MTIVIQKGWLRIAYKGRTHCVKWSDIEYVEADQWLCRIYSDKQEIVCAVRLGALCKQLSEYPILRCHKGFAVNLQRIRSAEPERITLDSGRTIPVGRTYKAAVTARMKEMQCNICEAQD